MADSTHFATILVTMVFFQFLTGLSSTMFKIANKCNYTVWPGIFSGTGNLPVSITGFALQPGESKTVTVPSAWSGHVWGRTLCSQDSTGKFSCVTGNCGSFSLECAGRNANPPVTLAVFTLNGTGGLDLFDVSLVEGFNIPMRVEPKGGTGIGNCRATSCAVDLNGACPAKLKVIRDGEGVACKSACCCSKTCKANSYLQFFKRACPGAYVYPYDNGISNFTCASADYLLTFCPTSTPSTR
ncbi:thaumatin-like protein 1b [Abrus precatorius]|uniref:Thaumatin-like protein 1b n=1 Tax=Abrus precatorius TaxID=3816 RepID=A0A8B8M0B9_ABRPR|nr:thaumatin-like protein 1b [Abrus precatorius]